MKKTTMFIKTHPEFALVQRYACKNGKIDLEGRKSVQQGQ